MQKQPNNITNLAKQNKQKYLKPQIFSISTTIKPTNNAHCRSLVDLNHIETSEEKQNNYDHFSSVNSNQDTKNINANGQWGKNQGKNGAQKTTVAGGNRHILVDKGNISNIAKILLNASKGKTVENRLQVSSNKNSSSQLHSQGRRNDVLMEILNPKSKMQARTSSQTNLRQINSSLTKTSANKQNNPSVLQPQKSQKSLKKNPHSQQSPHSSLYHQLPHHSHQQSNNPTLISQCNLLLKLKQYIEELKQNQQTHLIKIKEASQLNRNLQQEMILLKDKIEVYQIREKEMIAKIKYQQAQIHKLTNNKKDGYKNHQDKNQCQEHLLIIQSLRNVINQQMTKIIEMETYKVQLNQHKSRNRQKKSDDCWETNQSEPGSEEKHHEVYSFKKRSNLNESSIYIQEEEKEHPYLVSSSHANHRAQKQKEKKKMKNYESIPQPYNQLIKCLKSDSRTKQKGRPALNQEYSHRSSGEMQFESQRQRQERDRYHQSSQAHEEEFDGIDEIRDKDQCSEDEILQEVGQYLQNIRRNVREG